MGFKATGHVVRPDLRYMTPAEVALFKRQTTDGVMTFFRTAYCQGVKAVVDGVPFECGEGIERSKEFCSKACFESKGGQHGEVISGENVSGSAGEGRLD
jgi:hypothetical protein